MENKLISDLNANGIVFIRNGGTNTLPGFISLSFAGKDAEAILHRMDLMGISISTGAACDSVNTQISHVLKSKKWIQCWHVEQYVFLLAKTIQKMMSTKS